MCCIYILTSYSFVLCHQKPKTKIVSILQDVRNTTEYIASAICILAHTADVECTQQHPWCGNLQKDLILHFGKKPWKQTFFMFCWPTCQSVQKQLWEILCKLYHRLKYTIHTGIFYYRSRTMRSMVALYNVSLWSLYNGPSYPCLWPRTSNKIHNV